MNEGPVPPVLRYHLMHGQAYFPKMRAILESITVEYFDGVVA